MSFLNRERDREFQLEVLAVQLRHERKTVRYSSQMAMGIAFLAFALTFFIAITVSPQEYPSLAKVLVWFYGGIGFLTTWFSLRKLKSLRFSEEEDIKRLTKKYLDW